MGVRVIAGETYGCLYDSISMVAFGPVFSHEETFGSPEAAVLDFIEWWNLRHGAAGRDLRTSSNVDLFTDRRLWLRERCGHVPPYRGPEDTFTNTEEDAAAFHAAHGEDYR